MSDENIDQTLTYRSALLHSLQLCVNSLTQPAATCVLFGDFLPECSIPLFHHRLFVQRPCWRLSLLATTGRVTSPFMCYGTTWGDCCVHLGLGEQEGLWALSVTGRCEDAVYVLLKDSADMLWDVKKKHGNVNLKAWLCVALDLFSLHESFFYIYI